MVVRSKTEREIIEREGLPEDISGGKIIAKHATPQEIERIGAERRTVEFQERMRREAEPPIKLAPDIPFKAEPEIGEPIRIGREEPTIITKPPPTPPPEEEIKPPPKVEPKKEPEIISIVEAPGKDFVVSKKGEKFFEGTEVFEKTLKEQEEAKKIQAAIEGGEFERAGFAITKEGELETIPIPVPFSEKEKKRIIVERKKQEKALIKKGLLTVKTVKEGRIDPGKFKLFEEEKAKRIPEIAAEPLFEFERIGEKGLVEAEIKVAKGLTDVPTTVIEAISTEPRVSLPEFGFDKELLIKGVTAETISLEVTEKAAREKEILAAGIEERLLLAGGVVGAAALAPAALSLRAASPIFFKEVITPVAQTAGVLQTGIVGEQILLTPPEKRARFAAEVAAFGLATAPFFAIGQPIPKGVPRGKGLIETKRIIRETRIGLAEEIGVGLGEVFIKPLKGVEPRPFGKRITPRERKVLALGLEGVALKESKGLLKLAGKIQKEVKQKRTLAKEVRLLPSPKKTPKVKSDLITKIQGKTTPLSKPERELLKSLSTKELKAISKKSSSEIDAIIINKLRKQLKDVKGKGFSEKQREELSLFIEVQPSKSRFEGLKGAEIEKIKFEELLKQQKAGRKIRELQEEKLFAKRIASGEIKGDILKAKKRIKKIDKEMLALEKKPKPLSKRVKIIEKIVPTEEISARIIKPPKRKPDFLLDVFTTQKIEPIEIITTKKLDVPGKKIKLVEEFIKPEKKKILKKERPEVEALLKIEEPETRFLIRGEETLEVVLKPSILKKKPRAELKKIAGLLEVKGISRKKFVKRQAKLKKLGIEVKPITKRAPEFRGIFVGIGKKEELIGFIREERAQIPLLQIPKIRKGVRPTAPPTIRERRAGVFRPTQERIQRVFDIKRSDKAASRFLTETELGVIEIGGIKPTFVPIKILEKKPFIRARQEQILKTFEIQIPKEVITVAPKPREKVIEKRVQRRVVPIKFSPVVKELKKSKEKFRARKTKFKIDIKQIKRKRVPITGFEPISITKRVKRPLVPFKIPEIERKRRKLIKRGLLETRGRTIIDPTLTPAEAIGIKGFGAVLEGRKRKRKKIRRKKKTKKKR